LQGEQQIALENERQKREDERRNQDRLFMRQQREEDLINAERIRAQDIQLAKEKQMREENITEQHRLQDLLIERERHEQDLNITIEQAIFQRQIEEQRLKILMQDHQLAEHHRKEDLNRENSALLNDFMQEVMTVNQLVNATLLELRVFSLIRQFNPLYNSLLIRFLYKVKLLSVEDLNKTTTAPLDLRGANLKDLDLDDMDLDVGDGKFH